MSEAPLGPAPEAVPTPRRSRRTLIIATSAAAVLVIAAVVVIVVLLTRPNTFTVNGQMALLGEEGDSYSNVEGGTTCTALDGYDDISAGTQVVVSDASGDTVAVGQLDAGKATSEACAFAFKIDDVPAGSKFYKVEVGKRGGLQYTEKELRAGVAVSLGS